MKFEDLPMPPSINSAYVNGPHGRFKSRQATEWTMQFNRAMLRYRSLVADSRIEIKEKIAQGYFLSLHLDFFFPHKKLISKDGKVKRLDPSNRIKLIEDALCNMLGFDDCYIFEIKARKLSSGCAIEKADCYLYLEKPNSVTLAIG